jgi:Flp pilus assembly protein TadD
MEIFVIMPFRDDFDDVYHIIKDSANQVAMDRAVPIKTLRADEITQPGRISHQVTESIRNADLVIADITGNNPNVMYELGYAHALEKTVVLLTQSVHESPFDVKDFRQVTYERNKLLRDCRPRLISSITSVVTAEGTGDEESPVRAGQASVAEGADRQVPVAVRRPGTRLAAELQEMYVELELYSRTHDLAQIAVLGKRLRGVIDTITLVGKVPKDDARITAGIIGNCAVIIENAEEYDLAESIFSRAMTLFPEYEGLRIQYAAFLFNRGREEEARLELKRAKELKPDDRRIPALEMRFNTQGNEISSDAGEALKQLFLADPGSTERAVPYLMYLERSEAPAEVFIEACTLWEKHSPEDQKLTARRALADFLAEKDEAAAIPLFESLVAEPALAPDNLHGALHNLATLLAKRGDKVAAKKHWLRAYSLNRNDGTVRTTLTQFLSGLGDFELARKVIRGEPVEM